MTQKFRIDDKVYFIYNNLIANGKVIQVLQEQDQVSYSDKIESKFKYKVRNDRANQYDANHEMVLAEDWIYADLRELFERLAKNIGYRFLGVLKKEKEEETIDLSQFAEKVETKQIAKKLESVSQLYQSQNKEMETMRKLYESQVDSWHSLNRSIKKLQAEFKKKIKTPKPTE